MTIEDESPKTDVPRIGPVGRVVRALGAALVTWFALQWLDAGMTWLSNTSTPANPWVWVLTGLAIYYGLYQLPESGFGRPWGKRVAGTSGVILLVAALSTLAVHETLWAAPLTWLLFLLDVAFLVAIAISYLAAVSLVTPGCEVGGLGELIRRLRRGFRRQRAWRHVVHSGHPCPRCLGGRTT